MQTDVTADDASLRDGDLRDRLRRRLTAITERAIARQATDGSMPAGCNGPYGHLETPVRNTAHWLIAFIRLYELRGHTNASAAAHRAVDYLLQQLAVDGGFVVRVRHHDGKDETNGLIGQAWVIEALVEAGCRLGRSDALAAAGHIFTAHRYVESAGAWRKVRPSGRLSGFDWTFNHQLWFCAAGALLIAAGDIRPSQSVRHFIGRLNQTLSLADNGLIHHANPRFIASGRWSVHPGRIARRVVFAARREQMHDKSLGYHAFNTYALGLIAHALPSVQIDRFATVRRACDVLMQPWFVDAVRVSRYGYPYNPPGWEAAYSLLTLNGRDCRMTAIATWLTEQDQHTWDEVAVDYTRGAADAATSAARIYEATRLV